MATSRSKNLNKTLLAAVAPKPKKPRAPRKKVVKTTKYNHIIFLVDESGSMDTIRRKTMETFNNFIGSIAAQNDKDQVNLVSLYTFNNTVRERFNEVDVKKNGTPAWEYRPNYGTALMDSTVEVINRFNDRVYGAGDHAFLFYVLTDGQEAHSVGQTAESVAAKINSLSDRWTVAALVPNAQGVHSAKRYGFPAGNIEIWQTTEAGLEAVERSVRDSFTNYASARTLGATQTRSLFSPDLSNLKTQDLSSSFPEVQARMYHAQKDYSIREFVEQNTGAPYRKGSAFYELTKKETVQNYKRAIVQSKGNRKFYDARQVLGLPAGDCKVEPGDHGNFRIFIQSTSVNRRIKAGQSVVVT